MANAIDSVFVALFLPSWLGLGTPLSGQAA